MRRKIAAGNWKMNGLAAQASEIEALASFTERASCEVLICPPVTLLQRLRDSAEKHGVTLGAQNCHANQSGAHTGDVSAEMLAEAGARYVIVGHSERRADHGETDSEVRAKAEAAWQAGLSAIICVGETKEQREAGAAQSVVGAQLSGSVPEGMSHSNTVIAYEPVWAIGTGLTPTLNDIAEMHDHIRQTLTARFGAEISEGIRLLYGGSVKASNATEIFAVSNVDGGLVGGASLKASDFGPIILAANQ